jgi:tryptophan-rich sensory protein
MSTSVPSRAATPVRGRSRRPPAATWLALLGFLVVAFAVAALGSLTTIGAVNGWYARVPHVAWTPPNWAFGAVWTLLYTMIAVAGWLVWLRRGTAAARVALGFWTAQLVLNALWTPVFFAGYQVAGLPALWLALAIILVLDLAVAATIALFWPVSRAAALLLVPYLLWILYASSLNWGDAVLVSLG